MTIKISTTDVSTTQLDLLRDAHRIDNPAHMLWTIDRVLLDDEISSGQEALHPEWLDIIQRNLDHLQPEASPKLRKAIDKVLDYAATSDKELNSIDPRKSRLSFLLGAGASKPAPSNIPTVKELLPQLFDRARRLERDDVNKLADFCERRKIDNIEDLLTAAQLATFCSRNPHVLSLNNFLLYRTEAESLERGSAWGEKRWRSPAADLSSVAFLQDTLQVLFGLLSSTMLPAEPNPAHAAIAEYLRTHTGSSVITTNYDCCMDLALGDAHDDFSYRMEFTNIKPSSTSVESKTRLIKLHGSLNWFYCETCQEVQLLRY